MKWFLSGNYQNMYCKLVLVTSFELVQLMDRLFFKLIFFGGTWHIGHFYTHTLRGPFDRKGKIPV